MTASNPDQDLLERIRNGNSKALGVLLERYWAPLVCYLGSLLKSDDAAEDVAQDTFVRMWERRDAWSVNGSVRALLYRVARNLALDELRRGDARTRADLGSSPPSPGVAPDEHMENDELRSVIARAVESLPARRREAFMLVRHHGLSYREAADVLELAPQTIANHLTLALTDLRAAVAPYFYDRSSDLASSHGEQRTHRSA